MGKTFKLSEAGLKLAKKAFDQSGKSREYIAGGAKCTRQLITQFLDGRPVAKSSFQAICYELDLEWKEVVYLEEEQSNISTNIENSVQEFQENMCQDNNQQRSAEMLIVPATTTTEHSVTSTHQVDVDLHLANLKNTDLSGADIDVFLCYNSEDKHEVEKIALKLTKQGIKPWLDVWHLPPGERWQPILERAIEQVSSVAVFIGSNGLAPWQDKRKDSILKKFDKRKRPIIPVLLSNAPQNLSLPRYLEGRTSVDFSQDDPNPISQLIWGITGNKLSRKRKFLTIYSYNNEDERTDYSTVIVLPAYDMEKVEGTNQFTSNTLKQKAAENLSQSPTKTAIKNDVIAGSFITSSFTKNLLPIPRIMWDEEKIFKGQETTYILIGLSNSKIDDLSKENIPKKYFSIDTFKEEKLNSFFIKCGRFDNFNKLCSIEQWDYYRENKNNEFSYAVFAKFEFGNKKIIVCGGITETDTNRLAWYLSENWEHIYSKLESEKGSSLDPNDSFALVIRIPCSERSEQSTDFVIERICIERIT